MQFTSFILLLAAMVASTVAMPVTTDAQAVDPAAPDANANYNLQPACPNKSTFDFCVGLNKSSCRGTKFIAAAGCEAQCSSCYCE